MSLSQAIMAMSALKLVDVVKIFNGVENLEHWLLITDTSVTPDKRNGCEESSIAQVISNETVVLQRRETI